MKWFLLFLIFFFGRNGSPIIVFEISISIFIAK